MFVSIIYNTNESSGMLQSVYQLAMQMDKDFAVLFLETNKGKKDKSSTSKSLGILLNNLDIQVKDVWIIDTPIENYSQFCDDKGISFMFFQLIDNKRQTISKHLQACRDLRLPYLLYKKNFSSLSSQKLLVPVSFLIEEREKAQFAAAFGRFVGTSITLLQAKDFGSKAATNIEKISTFLDRFQLDYQVQLANKDSFKLHQAALRYAKDHPYDLMIISASRAYGLDDLIFGPEELHLIKRSNIPILLINPRDDLYVLCD